VQEDELANPGYPARTMEPISRPSCSRTLERVEFHVFSVASVYQTSKFVRIVE